MNSSTALYTLHERIWHWLQAGAMMLLILTGIFKFFSMFPILTVLIIFFSLIRIAQNLISLIDLLEVLFSIFIIRI